MNPKDHPLFKQFPIQSTVQISTGTAPTPYQIYDGFGLFIGGSADFAAVKHLLKNENIVPVQTSDGKALMGIWVCNFTDASLNPHHELQFSFFVSRQEIAPITHHPFNVFTRTITNKGIQMMCHGLWNNTPNVVAYNREVLSLNAIQTDSKIERKENGIDFTFEDTSTNDLILSGSVKNINTASLSATFSFMSRLGFQQSTMLMRQPWVSLEVVNPIGILNRNAAARTYTKNDTNLFHFFNSTNRIKIAHPLYKPLNFTPHAMQYMNGIKFIYLQPE